MSDDLRDHLEDLADRLLDDAPDAFTRLEHARRRRTTTRKVGTLIVALAVAVAGTTTAIAAFDDDGRSRAAGDPSASPKPEVWTPPDVLTVWPENPLLGGDVEQIQAAADAGDASVAWRLDPQEVARRFSSMVLGWSEMTAIERDIETDPPDSVRAYDINPCPPDAVCDMETPMPTLWLVQPAATGDGGIWSVASIHSRPLGLRGLEDDAVLFAGAELRFAIDVPNERVAHLGIVASNGCTDLTEFVSDQSSGTVELIIPTADVEEGCSETAIGYAFTYVQDVRTVPVGDPLLEAATIEWPFMTLVPIRIDLRGRSHLDVLRIRCPREGLETEIDQRVVVAGPRGIAIHVGGGDETPQLVFDSFGRRGATYLNEIPAFVHLTVGRHGVSCIYEGDVIGDEETFTVVEEPGS